MRERLPAPLQWREVLPDPGVVSCSVLQFERNLKYLEQKRFQGRVDVRNGLGVPTVLL